MAIIGNVGSLPPPVTPRGNDPSRVAESQGAPVVDGNPTVGQKQPGVVRNLIAGHFKGVADVRLRMNFADQLGAVQAAATAAVAADATAAFTDDAAAAIGDLLQHPELTPEQHEAVNEVTETFLDRLASIDGTVTSATSEFELQLANLRVGLTQALTAVAPTPLVAAPDPAGDVEPAMAVPSSNQVTDSSTLLADAQALVEFLEESLASAVQSVGDSPPLLPPLSYPSGRGAAYAKFLTIYEGMAEPAPSDAGESEAPLSIDASA